MGIVYILIILLLLFLLLILWILWARMVICIDSDHSLYYVEMRGLIRIQLLPERDRLLMHISIPFTSFEFDLVEKIMAPKKVKEEKEKKKEKKKGRFQIKKGIREIMALVFRLIRSIHRSFKVERFYVNIDTGNAPLNAKLIPLFYLMNNSTRMGYYVNFNDRNVVHILIKNRLIRIVLPIVKTGIRLYS